MASSVIEMEINSRRPAEYEPIQIMVPVNLRKKFRSSSIRNFTMYALPCVKTSEFLQPFEILVTKINEQLMQQLSGEHLSGMISTSVRLQKMRIVRDIPLSIKETVLRLCFRYRGKLYINFIRRSGKEELEWIFFQRLAGLGCKGIFEN